MECYRADMLRQHVGPLEDPAVGDEEPVGEEQDDRGEDQVDGHALLQRPTKVAFLPLNTKNEAWKPHKTDQRPGVVQAASRRCDWRPWRIVGPSALLEPKLHDVDRATLAELVLHQHSRVAGPAVVGLLVARYPYSQPLHFDAQTRLSRNVLRSQDGRSGYEPEELHTRQRERQHRWSGDVALLPARLGVVAVDHDAAGAVADGTLRSGPEQPDHRDQADGADTEEEQGADRDAEQAGDEREQFTHGGPLCSAFFLPFSLSKINNFLCAPQTKTRPGSLVFGSECLEVFVDG